MSKSKLPKYCRQKDSRRGDRAFVQLGDQRVYLGAYGEYGSPESRELYRRAVAEWLEGGRQTAPQPNSAPLTVVELAAKFWTFAEGFYRKPDGTKTSSLEGYRLALRPLKQLYGSLPVTEIGPLCLKAVRAEMVRNDISRGTANKLVNLIRRVFKWGVSEELVPPKVYQALQAVEALRRGRTEARETKPVLPVPEERINEIYPHVSRQVRALIELQLLTGARPGELLDLRTVDIKTGGRAWTYEPNHHKTAWHGHSRTIYFGPRAQDVLQPFLNPKVNTYCFSPAEAEAERRKTQHARRKTPMNEGNRPGSNRVTKPKTSPGDRYNIASYRVAIQRACLKVHAPPARLLRQKGETKDAYRARMQGPDGAELRAWREQHCWHPHQLRHNAATWLRQEFGIDVAQTILGHRLGSSITEIYTGQNVQKAMEAICKAG